MKKRVQQGAYTCLTIILCLAILTGSVYATVTVSSSGSCGKSVKWKLDSNGTLTISGTGRMADYDSFEAPWHDMTVRKIVIQQGVTSIGNCAFEECELTSVSIPNTVKTIGEHAFNGCEFLQSVSIPNSVTKIGRAAFNLCVDLTNVKLPNALTEIAPCTFCYCSLKSISIPNGVARIGEAAFYGCDFTKLTIPSSVKSIGDSAFWLCHNLSSVTIPSGVKSIGVEAFMDCNLQKVTIPGSVYYIGSKAFDSKTAIQGVKGSAAERYAKSNGNKFSVISSQKTATPTISKVENIKGGVKITLKPVNGAFEYRVLYKTGNGKWTKAGDTVGTTFIWKKAKSGTMYFFTVQSLNKNGNAISSYNTTGKSITYVAAPSLSSLKNTKSKTISIVWKKVSGASGYEIQCSMNKNFQSGVRKATVKSSTSSMLMKSLSKGKTWYVRIRSYKTVSGKKVYSAWSGFGTIKIKK